MSERERCPIVAQGGGERCALEMNHNSPHQSEDGCLTWQPLYVADLERKLEDAERDSWKWTLISVLDDIGDALHSEAIDEARADLARVAPPLSAEASS